MTTSVLCIIAAIVMSIYQIKGWKMFSQQGLVQFSARSRNLSFQLQKFRVSNVACQFLSNGNSRLFMSASKGNSNTSLVQSVVICGPSGVGKGTLIARLLQEYPMSFALSVSHTSRKPRPGEIDGIHYNFIDKQAFEEDIQHGKYRYIETAQVHGNLYGTREDAIYKIHEQGKICILDIDTKGVESLKQMQFPMKSIFIIPPSLDNLQERLVNRQTESPEVIALRIHNAKVQMEYGLTPYCFDAILVNDDVNAAYAEFVHILKNWFPQYINTLAAK